MCWIAENCWAKPSTVSPNSPAWEMGALRKRALSTSFISARLSQRWRSWTTMVDIAFPRDRAVTFVARRAKSVAERSSCINPGLVLQIYIQWGKKVFSQPPIVQVLPLKKMREACNFHHRYTSTMRDKIRKTKSRKSHCRICKEFICKLWWKISIWSITKFHLNTLLYTLCWQ